MQSFMFIGAVGAEILGWSGIRPSPIILSRKGYFYLIHMKCVCAFEGMQIITYKHINACVSPASSISSCMYIRWVNVTPIFDKNMNKITHRQAAIDSSMPGEFKKWN